MGYVACPSPAVCGCSCSRAGVAGPSAGAERRGVSVCNYVRLTSVRVWVLHVCVRGLCPCAGVVCPCAPRGASACG